MKSTTATTSAPTEESRQLLSRRVAAFALVFGGINLVGVAGRGLGLLVFPEELRFLPAGAVSLQAAATATLFAIWALTRSGTRSARFVRWVEAIGIVVVADCYLWLALLMTDVIGEVQALQELAADPERGFLGVMPMMLPTIGASFILTYAMVLRAAFVPTSTRHTAALTAAVGMPLAITAWLVGEHAASPVPFAAPWALSLIALWQWGITVVICVAISRVIYGLQAQVREAEALGQYVLEGLIGEGGMGKVYRASHAMLRRPTAVKLLPPDRMSEHSLERFEREVRLTAQLTHPNTVTIFDYGRTGEGIFYYAMELLDGASLEEVVGVDGPQPAARVLRILQQVAGALGEAHSIGLIHRDVKPANIVLCRQGGELDVAKVVDFGLVKELSQDQSPALSQDGSISGTPLYMAPEILKRPEAASPASDLYALGAVGYYLLTGTHVFDGDSVIEVLGHHLHTEPEPPSRRLGDDVPSDLEELILECLAKEPSARPADADELRRRLDECEDVGEWRARSAEKWWDAHGPGLTQRRTAPPIATPTGKSTMAVDLAMRSGFR